MHTKTQLISDISALGIRAGDTVLMHSSYKSLGGIEDGAAGFFDAFLTLLGEAGTLVLPALSYASVTRDNPEFDLKTTPSCIGYLPEYFREQVPGVVRSQHPTHSCCAVGRNADFLTREHGKDRTPVGPHSPFARLPMIGGKILILGSHPDHNTTLHGVEETAEPEYLFDRTSPIVYTVTDADGNRQTVTHLRHGFHRPQVDYAQRYARILNLLDETEVSYGKVLDADCVLMDAAAVWERGHNALVSDPLYFVDIIPK
ncbi:MAG: AAC(3) family N-acetyltransferase [Clostridia bacterium]|nr:AAC(3) family N-acetyltransferase [Clostridia bacterium]